MNKAIFLDRDGVINHDPGDYTMRVEEFALLPTTVQALKLASNAGYLLIIITNQGGIAKGLYTADEVAKMHQLLHAACEKAGVEITHIYYSPHHPDHGNSLSRKPGSLLMERALARYHIDATRSVMIGDRERDVQCAGAAGVRGILIPTNAPLVEYISSFLQTEKQV